MWGEKEQINIIFLNLFFEEEEELICPSYFGDIIDPLKQFYQKSIFCLKQFN